MRRKADGSAFEREFRDCMKESFYVRRLHTMNTGYSGMTQPADFVVVGDQFNYVELKETKGDSFSITAMQQFEELKEYLQERSRLCICRAVRESRYWIIVHFLEYGVIKVVEGAKALEMSNAHKTIRVTDDTIMQFASLKEMKEKLIL